MLQPPHIPRFRSPRRTRRYPDTAPAGVRASLGVDHSGLVEYAALGAHVYAFGPGDDPPRLVGRYRSPNRRTNHAALVAV